MLQKEKDAWKFSCDKSSQEVTENKETIKTERKQIDALEKQIYEQKQVNCLKNDKNLELLYKVEQLELKVDHLEYRNSLIKKEIDNFIDSDKIACKMLDDEQIIDDLLVQKPTHQFAQTMDQQQLRNSIKRANLTTKMA